MVVEVLCLVEEAEVQWMEYMVMEWMVVEWMG